MYRVSTRLGIRSNINKGTSFIQSQPIKGIILAQFTFSHSVTMLEEKCFEDFPLYLYSVLRETSLFLVNRCLIQIFVKTAPNLMFHGKSEIS